MNAYLNAMRRYFDFKGRASRTEFWMFTLVVFVGGIIAFIFDLALGNAQNGPPFITALWVIPHYIPALAVAVRRLHDIDRTGWWVLIGIIPIGALVLIVFYCQASTPGANRFGGATTDAGAATVDRAGQAMPSASVQQAHSAVTLAAGGHSAAPGSSAAPAPLAELERLVALRASGVIDEAEFTRLKAAVINPTSA
ncbi:DUF805 domain-containing protein [Shinella sp. S4-D37]|uniref:DUF805 domain-containing protein n=1 Tax=Shinella sp. S4-D37 TaxID=3161999 RepID=UPI003466FF88